MTDDPFPREAFGTLLRRLPAYGRLAWRLGRDPFISRARRALLAGAVGYLASPIDLVPGVIPVLGQLDDIAFVLAALKVALSGLDPARRGAHLAAVGLSDADLATDLRTVRTTAGWIVRAGGRTGRRVVGAGARAAIRGTRLVGRTTARGRDTVAASLGGWSARIRPQRKAFAADDPA
jgi:uncharacterized membrane protein YkvA (DUF1232 family)